MNDDIGQRSGHSRPLRAVHPFDVKADNSAHPLRIVGNSANILALATAMICAKVNLTQDRRRECNTCF